jgi:P-type Ca2+ transporter type 2C
MTSAPEAGASPQAYQGLSEDQALLLLEQRGANAVPAPAPPRTWRRVLVALSDPLILVLLVAAVVTMATGDTTDSFIIAAVVVVNTTVGVA